MARRRGCGGCLVRTLITLVVIAVILFTAGWFGGNALMKKYIGDEGSFIALGINNWNDMSKFFTVFKGNAPETEEGDRVSAATKEKTENYFESKNITIPVTADGKPDYAALFDGRVSVTEEFGLDGGMIAVILDACLDSVGTLSDYGARVEAATVAAESDVAGSLSVVMSLKKSVMLDQLKVEGFGRTVIDLLLRGDTVYLTLSLPLKIEEGKFASIAADAAAQPAMLVNGLGDADSARIVGTIAAAVQPDAKNSFVRDLANAITDQFNKTQSAGGAVISLAKDYDFGAGVSDAIVLKRQQA